MQQQTYWKTYEGSAPENYERYFVPTLFGPWATDLIELAKPREGERVLDVACGTGIVALLAARHVGATGKVAGLDINPGMLAVARTQTPAGVPIEWHEASADAMPFADASFDLVLCQQGLQFFPNRSAALREVHRVLVPGGRLALSVWQSIEHAPGFAALTQALDRHIGPEAAGFMYAAYSLGSADELRELVEDAGFHEVVIHPASRMMSFPPAQELTWQYVQSAPFADKVIQAGDDAQSALVSDVTASTQQYIDGDGLRFPMGAHIATARKQTS